MSRVQDFLRACLGRFRTESESDHYRFDVHLSSLIDAFNEVLDIGHGTRPEGAAQDKLKNRAEDIAARMKATSPPDAEWREVLEDYIKMGEIHLRYFGHVLPEDEQRKFAAINDRANLRREQLQEVYRSGRR